MNGRESGHAHYGSIRPEQQETAKTHHIPIPRTAVPPFRLPLRSELEIPESVLGTGENR